MGIVALHIVFAYVLTKGLMPPIIEILDPSFRVVEVPVEQPPPPPQRTITDPDIVKPHTVPVPLPPIPDVIVEDPPFSTTAEPETGPIILPPEAPPVVIQPPVRLVGRNVLPNTESYYPASSRRSGVEGAAVVRACVNENGRLADAPVIEASSGSAALDDAAVRVARDGRYARSVRGDTPVPNCHRFRVIFSMK
jgi:TonB family protein